MKYHSLIFLLSFLGFRLFAQGYSVSGNPYIRNYRAKEYKAHAQNWAITQDHRGVMYFGNVEGVLEYDGVSWRLIRTAKSTLVRSLATDKNGTIYVGAQGEFGYLSPDSLGQLHYLSLLNFVKEEERQFDEIWGIYATEEGVYFQSSDKLFRWSDNQMRVWHPTTSFHLAFFVNNRLYVCQPGLGLMELIKDSLQLISGGERFAKELIYVMRPYKKHEILIGTQYIGLFIYDGKTTSPLSTNVNSILAKTRLYNAIALPDGRFALATFKGLILMDEEGHVLNLLDKSTGLQDEIILYPYLDREGNLWLALNNGISRVEMLSPLTIYDEHLGLGETATDIITWRGKLYVTTFRGIFYLDLSTTVGTEGNSNDGHARFKSIAGISEDCWALLSMGESLLVATSKGVYDIANEQHRRISSGYALSLCRSRRDTQRVFIGLRNGLASISRKKGYLWMEEGRTNGIHEEIGIITESEDGTLWLGTHYTGILRITFPPNISDSSSFLNPKIERFNTDLELGPVAPFSTRRGQRFAGKNGIYTFDKENSCFVKDTIFSRIFHGGSGSAYAVVEDRYGNLWTSQHSKDRGISVIGMITPATSYERSQVPLFGFSDLKIYGIYPDPEMDSIVWFSGPDGLLRLNTKWKKNKTMVRTALIRKATVNRDSVIFGGFGNNKEFCTLGYVDNTLRFAFSLPSFLGESWNEFQFYLEGMDTDWSNWTNETKKEYNNLSSGLYRFRVRARNIYDEVSEEGIYSLEILPPFWKTGPFALLCAIAIVAIGFLIYKLRVSQILKVERMRLSIASDLHDEIGSSLSHIALLTEMMSSQSMLSEKEKLQLVNVSDKAREMVESMSHIVWAINPLYDKFNDLLLRMKDVTQEMLSQKQIACDIDFPDECVPQVFTMHFRRNIFLIYKEILHNVLRHSKATRVQIQLSLVNGSLELKVKDNGIGFNMAYATQGNGLHNMQTRAKELGGNIEIESRVRDGTAVVLKVNIPQIRYGLFKRPFIP